MSFRFIGESLPELRAHAPADRRRVYFRAVRASYRSWKTWLGCVALVVLLASDDPAVKVLIGIICMGALQVWAIQDALRNPEHQPLSDSKVSEPPQKLIIVVGIWLIFGTTALAAIAAVFHYWGMAKPVAAIMSLGIGVFSALVTAQATRSFLRRRQGTDQSHG